jgi:hypothetical protein
LIEHGFVASRCRIEDGDVRFHCRPKNSAVHQLARAKPNEILASLAR